MDFVNCYEDTARVYAYATLEFKNTYYLAYRDLPAIITEHVHGRRAVDFGCGTGRSTRFLRQLGFEVVGVDIAHDMIRKAHEPDPSGDYQLVPGDDLSGMQRCSYDLVLSMFTFDNIPAGKTRFAFSAVFESRWVPTARSYTLSQLPKSILTSGHRSRPKSFPKIANAAPETK